MGKGDSPRNCFSREFRENYDSINWDAKKKTANNKIVCPSCFGRGWNMKCDDSYSIFKWMCETCKGKKKISLDKFKSLK